MSLIGAALALVAVGIGLVAFIRLPPRHALAAAVLAGAAAAAALRMFPIAIPAAVIGLRMWSRAGATASSRSTGRPQSGASSEVRTAGLAMGLDHDTGTMDGEILVGRLTGRRLSSLTLEELQSVLDQFEAASDADSATLLVGYLERRGGSRRPATPPPAGVAMSDLEAYRVLGLEPGATREEVRAAHRRLIKRVHPDLGGSSPLAAMINAAKEKLDPS